MLEKKRVRKTVIFVLAFVMIMQTLTPVSVTKAAGNQTAAQEDAELLEVKNIEDVRESLTLPEEGEKNQSMITWESSHPSVITDEPGKTSIDKEPIPIGLVARPSADTKVTLTATITAREDQSDVVQKEFTAYVKAANQMADTEEYLFAYFPYTSNRKQEQVFMAVSEEAFFWTDLNITGSGTIGSPVLESVLGEKGIRDPFIIRSGEGDKFYIIATDLKMAGGIHSSWNSARTKGSHSIMIWESTDLVNWSEQRMAEIAVPEAGCTWAPEAFYDEESGQYIVFWASTVSEDNYEKHRMYYSMTRDFYTFTEAKVWMEESHAVIDTNMVKDGEWYYRYTKNEDGEGTSVEGKKGKRVYAERSKSLFGDWEIVNTAQPVVYDIKGEGPTVFKLNEKDRTDSYEWCCLIDNNSASNYFPTLAKELSTGNFLNASHFNKQFVLPEGASHGNVIPVTSEEYDDLQGVYGAERIDGTREVAAAAAALTIETKGITSNLDLPKYGAELPNSDGSGDVADIRWTSSNPLVISNAGRVRRPEEDEKVTLTANITCKDAAKQKKFEVTVKAKEKPIETEKPVETEDPVKEKEAKAVTALKDTKVESSVSLYTGKTKQINYTLSSEFQKGLNENIVKIKEVSYKTANSKVATVSSTGKIKGIKAGTTKITTTISLTNGNYAKFNTTIKVKKPTVAITGKKKVKVGKKITLKAKGTGVSGKVKWSVNNKKRAKISSKKGVLTGIKKGNVKITAKIGAYKKTMVVKVVK